MRISTNSHALPLFSSPFAFSSICQNPMGDASLKSRNCDKIDISIIFGSGGWICWKEKRDTTSQCRRGGLND